MFDNLIPAAQRGDDLVVLATRRRVQFEAEFGSGREVAVAIRNCLIEAYAKVHAIVGEEVAEIAFESLVARGLRTEVPAGGWRRVLHANEDEICTRIVVGRAFRELAAYARYGISLNGGLDEAHRLDLLDAAQERARELQVLTHWHFKGTELETILLQADARLDLDTGQPVNPTELAALARVSEQVIRDLIRDGELPSAGGRVPAVAAHAWLTADTKDFQTSIWRLQEPFRDLRGIESLDA